MHDIFLGNPQSKIKEFIKEHYTPLTFTAQEAGATMSFRTNSLSYEYSQNDGEWTTYASETPITLVNVDDTVSFRSINSLTSNTCRGCRFTINSGKIAASGNIQSLLDKTCQRTYVPVHCYRSIFSDCSALTHAPALPATTLANNCYYYMFQDCSSLSSAPALPATTLVRYCYSNMFNGCTSLTSAPELSATTLADYCCESMFYSTGISEFTVDMTACTSIPSLPSSTLFSSSNKPYTILVPASLYDDWIEYSNWSIIASNIKAV